MSNEEIATLIIRVDNSDRHRKYSQERRSLQEPDAGQDDSGEGEHFDSLPERNVENPTTNCDTLIHLLKGNIGAGILAMPYAFKNAGLTTGTIGTILIGLICIHAMHVLVKCAHDLCKRTGAPSMSYAQVAELSFLEGPLPLRRFSSFAKMVIVGFLCITQLGACCVYFVFVAKNLKQVNDAYGWIDWKLKSYVAVLLLPMIFLNFVRSLKFLTPFSWIANVITTVGLGIIFYYIFRDPLPPIHRDDFDSGFASWEQLPLYFGTAIYAFEGIGVVLPLENKMKTPEAFGGWNGVLNTGMVIVMCLYTGVGFFGYLKYGSQAKGSVTLNLNEGENLAESVRVMMAISIFLSYALQFYVAMEIMWPPINRRLPTTGKMQLISEYAFRTLVVIFTFAMAELIPNLGLFISLVGAGASSSLAIIFPPLINILTHWNTGYGRYRWELCKDIAVMLFGLVGFLAGTYVSIKNILSEQHRE